MDQLRAILTDFHVAGLEPAEVAIMDFAEKIARSANEMTQADVDVLRALGLEDVEILDITLTATMRCFASKTFNALGAGSDAAFDALEGQLSDLLPGQAMIGRIRRFGRRAKARSTLSSPGWSPS